LCKIYVSEYGNNAEKNADGPQKKKGKTKK